MMAVTVTAMLTGMSILIATIIIRRIKPVRGAVTHA
jgi:hypothetical protein